MKKLSDNSTVPERCWYYVLDWKDKNMELFEEMTGQQSVHKLTKSQFLSIFSHAANTDIASVQTKLNKNEVITALHTGKKVTHRLFDKGDYVYLKENTLHFDDGTSQSWTEFWEMHNYECWSEDWEVCK